MLLCFSKGKGHTEFKQFPAMKLSLQLEELFCFFSKMITCKHSHYMSGKLGRCHCARLSIWMY